MISAIFRPFLSPLPSVPERDAEPRRAILCPARDLEEIQAREVLADGYRCHDPNPHRHQRIVREVLPFIIERHAMRPECPERKEGAAGQRLTETLRRLQNADTYSDRGQKTTELAELLAGHLLSTECQLAEAIVAELFDRRCMFWIKNECQLKAGAVLICEAMQSNTESMPC